MPKNIKVLEVADTLKGNLGVTAVIFDREVNFEVPSQKDLDRLEKALNKILPGTYGESPVNA